MFAKGIAYKGGCIMGSTTFSRMRAVAVLFVVGLALFLLAGCSGPTPTEVAQQFLDGVKADDAEALQASYSGDPNTLFSSELEDVSAEADAASADAAAEDQATAELQGVIDDELTPKLREFDYEISNEQIDGDMATVDVKMTTYAAGEALTSFVSDYVSQAIALAFSGASEEEISELATSLFSSKMKTMEKNYTDTVTLNLTKVDGSWKVDALDVDSEMSDALMGGLISAASTMESAYGGLSSDGSADAGTGDAAA